MGNAVGPVALIAAGIYLGYLTITGRAANFANFLASGGQSTAPDPKSATTGTVQNAVTTTLSTAPGSSMTGTGAAQTGSVFGLLPAGAPGTAAGMSEAQASNAAIQTLQNYSLPAGN